MIVPDFWAEAKRKEKINGRQVTIKRFGWSIQSEEDALENAQERVDEAMMRALSGEEVRKIDHKIAYNGGEGLPIREEVISRHGDVVITRNTYGALCLNTPDVLFADIDLDATPTSPMWFGSVALLVLFAFSSGIWMGSWPVFFGLLFCVLIFSSSLAHLVLRLSFIFYGLPEKQFRESLDAYVDKFKKANFRVYRTPNGFRVLALHKLFEPKSEEVKEMFLSLGVDKVYSHMCRNQNCFRARVSPKPWRIGVKRMGPRPGTWPIKQERMFARNVWVNTYDDVSKDFASCVLDSTHGSDVLHPKAELVLKLHDDFSKAESKYPIA